MLTKTVSIGSDGAAITVTKSDDDAPPLPPPPGSTAGMPVVLHAEHHHRSLDSGSFVAGLMLGLLLYFIAQNWIRWQRHRPVRFDRDDADQARMAADVAALARRTATLETIVTDPAQRTARDIDALR